MTRHRIRDGDFIRLISTSTLAARLLARVTVRFDSGRQRMIPLADVATTTRSIEFTDRGPIEEDGEVVRAIVTGTGLGKRGQNLVELAVINQNEETLDILAQDYLYNGHTVGLDANVSPGPGGGNGHIFNNVIADDIAPVDIEHTFGITNALRRIDGFIWYYHASSDVASRTMRVSMRDMGDGLPTGMTSGLNTTILAWPSAGPITLTANQEGLIYVNAAIGKSFASSTDTGAFTVENSSSAPDPFPYWAAEDDVGELFFDVSNEEAADRHSIYIIEEQWINV